MQYLGDMIGWGAVPLADVMENELFRNMMDVVRMKCCTQIWWMYMYFTRR